jgi:hypothetical protein
MKTPAPFFAFLCLVLISATRLQAQDGDEDGGTMEVFASKDAARFKLDDLLGSEGMWELGPAEIEARYKPAGFTWLSQTARDRGQIRPRVVLVADGARRVAPQRSTLAFLDGSFEAEEANLEFRNDKLAMVTISVWNKGDSASLSEKAFTDKVAAITAALTGKLGVRAQDLGRETASAARANRTRWDRPVALVQLEHSSAKDRVAGFQGEFIRVRVAPKVRGIPTTSNTATVTQAELVKRVRRLENGDILIDSVPMVDQGEKGYCALATVERVMRYYGIECDQHEMAKVAGADAFGTDPDQLQTALHKLQGRFRIRVRDLIHWDIKDYEKFTDSYNREARRIGARQCPEGYIWISFQGLDKDALREARCRGAGYGRFVARVKELIDRGVPLPWSLELGIYPENGEQAPQAGGGHMRLIIGYNPKTGDLLFSDSWGPGHELKRMPIKDAYAVTKGLYLIEPQAR